jgi:hypothetical protein
MLDLEHLTGGPNGSASPGQKTGACCAGTR